jgi:hypothetical protein
MINEKRKKENVIYNQIINNFPNKEPIRRGCNNGSCFCSGACQEIIGWKDVDNSHFFPPQQEQPIFPIQKEESHFEDIEESKTCSHIEHKPPMHLHIPQGKRYVHICPACRERTIIQPQ